MDEDPLIPGPMPFRPEFRDRMRTETTRLVRRPSPAPLVWGSVVAASLLVASLTAWWILSRPLEPQLAEPRRNGGARTEAASRFAGRRQSG